MAFRLQRETLEQEYRTICSKAHAVRLFCDLRLYRAVLRSRLVRKQLADQIMADKLVMERYKLMINLNLTRQIYAMKQVQLRKARLAAQR